MSGDAHVPKQSVDLAHATQYFLNWIKHAAGTVNTVILNNGSGAPSVGQFRDRTRIVKFYKQGVAAPVYVVEMTVRETLIAPSVWRAQYADCPVGSPVSGINVRYYFTWARYTWGAGVETPDVEIVGVDTTTGAKYFASFDMQFTAGSVRTNTYRTVCAGYWDGQQGAFTMQRQLERTAYNRRAYKQGCILVQRNDLGVAPHGIPLAGMKFYLSWVNISDTVMPSSDLDITTYEGQLQTSPMTEDPTYNQRFLGGGGLNPAYALGALSVGLTANGCLLVGVNFGARCTPMNFDARVYDYLPGGANPVKFDCMRPKIGKLLGAANPFCMDIELTHADASALLVVPGPQSANIYHRNDPASPSVPRDLDQLYIGVWGFTEPVGVSV